MMHGYRYSTRDIEFIRWRSAFWMKVTISSKMITDLITEITRAKNEADIDNNA